MLSGQKKAGLMQLAKVFPLPWLPLFHPSPRRLPHSTGVSFVPPQEGNSAAMFYDSQ